MICNVKPALLVWVGDLELKLGCQSLSDTPISNLVFARHDFLTNCACVSWWSCTHEPTCNGEQENGLSKMSNRC